MEEDDSGYEARSTVTTSNSTYQTGLQQFVSSDLNSSSTSPNRPATVNYSSNYSSNYTLNSLIISTNELRSPRSSQNSGLIASRPQSSAYSTISSCSLNRSYQPTLIEQQQQYPRLEVYQPLDQFRLLDQINNQYSSNLLERSSNIVPRNMSINNRSLNSPLQRTSSPDYEQDWSTGEQDEDSDYVIDHIRSIDRPIELSPTNLPNRIRFRYLEEEEEDENYNHNNDDDDILKENNENHSNEDDGQLINILNSPLDRSPLFSTPLSLPSSNLSNSNSNSNHNSSNSSPTCLIQSKPYVLNKQIKHSNKLKLSPESFVDSETSLESPKSLNSLNSPQSSIDLPLSTSSSTKQQFINNTTTIYKPNCSSNSEPLPISEEEFASRKKNLRERINNTFRILNSINNNCNRFRTIQSRSQELLNQRRQAELEIDNIVQNSGNVQQTRLERDLKSTTTIDQPQKKFEIANSSNLMNDEMNETKMLDRTQLQLTPTTTAGDTNKLITIETKNETTNVNTSPINSNKFSKDNEQSIDHLTKLNVQPTPSLIVNQTNNHINNLIKNKPPSIPDSKVSSCSNSVKERLNTSNDVFASRANSATENKSSSSILNLNSSEQVNKNFDNKNRTKFLDRKELINSVQSELNKDVKIDKRNEIKNDLINKINNETKNLDSDLSDVKQQTSKSDLTLKGDKLLRIKRSYRNSKIKNELKNNLSGIKSDLNDLSDLLNIPTTSSSTNIKLMSFVVQPKSVNTDIDSSLMDHILAKICEQRENQSSNNNNNNDSNNIASTSSNPPNFDTTTSTNTTTNQSNQDQQRKQIKESNKENLTKKSFKEDKKTMNKKENTESRHCQTDKIQIQNQDASVSVNENDLKSQEKDKNVKKKTLMTNSESGNDDEKNRNEEKRKKRSSDKIICENQNEIDSSESESSNSSKIRFKNSKCDCRSRKKVCELCKDKAKKRCHSTKQLIECNRQFDRQESLNHCCIKRSHESCATLLQHLYPVCLNTFNHNTFTSLPNLVHSLNRIEQGTNTEPTIDPNTEVKSNKQDKQIQCILGLSIEEQQREYIEQQQQKFLKLKKEQLKQSFSNATIKPSTSPIKKDDKPVQQNDVEVTSKDKEIMLKDQETKPKDQEISSSEISKAEVNLNKSDRDQSKDDEIKSESKRVKKSHGDDEIETKKDFKSDSEKVSTKSEKKFKVDSESEKEIIEEVKDKISNEKDENSTLVKSSNDELTDSTTDEKKLDITLPLKSPFEHQTSKIGRKLIDLAKDKNVKTHSKIIIEFSGQSKRERSAIDSFTKLEKDGRLTKKTLVSNTKEISVPIRKTKEEKEMNIYQNNETPNIKSNQLVTNDNVYLLRNQSINLQPSNHQWKEASHSEITNEIEADPLVDEENKAHPTRSITLSTITTFDRTAQDQPQRIDHSNKYKRCFENPSIHEPVIESSLTMLDESNLSNQEDQNLSTSNSLQTLNENLNLDEIKSNINEVRKAKQNSLDDKRDVDTNEMNNLKSLKIQPSASKSTSNEYRKSDVSSSNESRSTESRLSTNSSSEQSGSIGDEAKSDEQELNLNSRSASRVSFNLPDNYRDDYRTDYRDDQRQTIAPSNYYQDENMKSDSDQIDNKERRLKQETNLQRPTNSKSNLHPTGLLETELDEHLFSDNEQDVNYDLNNSQDDNKDENKYQRRYHKSDEERSDRQYEKDKLKSKTRSSKSKTAKVSKNKEKKSKSTKSTKRKKQLSESQQSEQQNPNSDHASSLFSTTTQPRSTLKTLHDSGFLSPEIYHSSPYELAYKQVNRDKEMEIERDKRKTSKSPLSSTDKKKSKSSKNLLSQPNGLQFTEHSSNTEIITRLTKTSYPSNYKEEHITTEKSLKHLKRNKMVLDQILNSPEIKNLSSSSKSNRTDKKKKSGCKISSNITMDLPLYKEDEKSKKSKSKSDKTKSSKSVSPVKSVSLEELDRERDLDRKSIVSQHSYSNQSGEFNTMTKFQRYKPSSTKSKKKNKSAIQLDQPDETNWEYTVQCNCVNGSKANVLTNVKHRRLLFFPLQQYETSL